tara:strand:+ start:118 stop:312 length:195 start_codon:yes stop_codon:yes gene_type:complete
MEDKLESLVGSFNKARGGETSQQNKSDGNSVSKIVQLLNQHYDQLANLQRQTTKLDDTISNLHR